MSYSDTMLFCLNVYYSTSLLTCYKTGFKIIMFVSLDNSINNNQNNYIFFCTANDENKKKTKKIS